MGIKKDFQDIADLVIPQAVQGKKTAEEIFPFAFKKPKKIRSPRPIPKRIFVRQRKGREM